MFNLCFLAQNMPTTTRLIFTLFCILSFCIYSNYAGQPNKYFSKESFEIDSSEHGVSQGLKNTTCVCGTANKESERVVRGFDAGLHVYPFVLSLVKRYEKRPFCGATIITAYHALTAAHCTQKATDEKFDLNVIYAEYDYTKAPSKARAIAVENFFQHKQYSPFALVNDISLLVLAKPLPFSDIVRPACLPNKLLTLDKQYVKLFGWGLTKHGGEGSAFLKVVNLRVVEKKSCVKEHSMMFWEQGAKQLCTFGSAKGACHGDSGGPVVWVDPETNRYTLVGIVSFGDICAGIKPSVNVDVASYLTWIKENIENSAHKDETFCTKKE